MPRGSSSYVVYAWQAPKFFLFREVLPHARRVHASPRDSAEVVLAAVHRGARFFLFHLNLSLTARFPAGRPRLVRALRERGIVPLNHALVDLTKRTLQRELARLGLPTTLASPAGDPRELVIVKTNYNCGGACERALRRSRRVRLGIAPPTPLIASTRDYRVLERRAVPDAFWRDPQLVVERYVGNPEGRFHRAYVLHDRLVVSTIENPRLVKKADPGLRRENHLLVRGAPHAAVAEPLRLAIERAAAGLGLDFGTVDVVEGEGGAFHVVDVNTTPYWGVAESQSALIAHLRVP